MIITANLVSISLEKGGLMCVTRGKVGRRARFCVFVISAMTVTAIGKANLLLYSFKERRLLFSFSLLFGGHMNELSSVDWHKYLIPFSLS